MYFKLVDENCFTSRIHHRSTDRAQVNSKGLSIGRLRRKVNNMNHASQV